VRAAAVLVLVMTTAVHAEPSAAEQAFERGRTLLTAGKVDEACAAFEDSLRLDFQYGTLFNLAQCDARRGKIATAFAEFSRIAKEDTVNSTRARRAGELAGELAPRVPKLRVIVGRATSAQVTLDGAPVDIAQPLPVDLGTHELVVDGQHRTITVAREGEEVEVAPPLAAPLPVIDAPPRAEPPHPPARSRTPALVTLGSGIAVAGAGLVVGGVAWRRWSDAQVLAMTDPIAADREVDRVRTLGNTSTAMVAIGAVAIAVGVYLWQR
jgi:hypothetical protein